MYADNRKSLLYTNFLELLNPAKQAGNDKQTNWGLGRPQICLNLHVFL
jgi:hypothetical protein